MVASNDMYFSNRRPADIYRPFYYKSCIHKTITLSYDSKIEDEFQLHIALIEILMVWKWHD